MTTLVVAAKKSLIARDLLTQEFPKLLKDYPYSVIDGDCYWRIVDIKWRDYIPEIKCLIEYFNSLEKEQDDSSEVLFGAIELPDDIDCEAMIWGAPEEFDIYLDRCIDAPI